MIGFCLDIRCFFIRFAILFASAKKTGWKDQKSDKENAIESFVF